MHSELTSPYLKPAGGKRVTTLVQLAACTMMFCLPWAGNVNLPGARFVSLGFNVCASILILKWIFTERKPFSSLPGFFLLFNVYILIHTIVVHGFLYSSEFMVPTLVNIGDGVEVTTSPYVLVARVTLFVLTVFSLSSLCANLTLLKNMALSLGASIVLILLLGGNSFVSTNGVRFSGGYANPNSFASVALLMGYLVAFVLSGRHFTKGTRLLAGCLLFVAVIVILLTASRSALVSVLGGGIVLLLMGDMKKGVLYSLFFLLLALVIAPLASPTLFSYAFSRFTSGESTGRFFIWIAYLQQWREYVEIGVGLGREMTVLKSLSYNGRIWPPHNTYLRILVAFGGVGFVFFCLSLRSMATSILRLYKFNRRDIRSRLLLAYLVSILIQIFFGDHLDNRALWVNLGMMGAYLSVYNQDRSDFDQSDEIPSTPTSNAVL